MGKDAGYTLIELMVAMAIFSIVMTAIYETYQYQQRVYEKNENVIAMQQEGRAGRYFMTRELQMAGYNPLGTADNATIVRANGAEMVVRCDLNGDGDTDDDRERARFALTADADTDGLADDFPCRLGRQWGGGGLQPIAENVAALQFCYELASGDQTLSPDATELGDIRSVVVTMLLRTARPLRGAVGQGRKEQTYTSAAADTSADTLTPDLPSGERPAAWTYEDAFQRQLLVFKVRCRNMGLNP